MCIYVCIWHNFFWRFDNIHAWSMTAHTHTHTHTYTSMLGLVHESTHTRTHARTDVWVMLFAHTHTQTHTSMWVWYSPNWTRLRNSDSFHEHTYIHAHMDTSICTCMYLCSYVEPHHIIQILFQRNSRPVGSVFFFCVYVCPRVCVYVCVSHQYKIKPEYVGMYSFFWKCACV